MSVKRNPKGDTRKFILQVITNDWIDELSILNKCIERFPDVFHKREWKDNRRTGTKLSAVQFHLKRLEKEDLIVSFRDKNGVKHYKRKGGMWDFETDEEEQITLYQ